MTIQKRTPYWDNFKGILIILVVFGHYLWTYKSKPFAEEIVEIIYMFHMPAFIFISGFLSRLKDKFDWISILKLFISYVIVNTLMMTYGYFILDSPIQLVKPYYSCWYLIALIVWRITLPFSSNCKGIVVLSILFSLMAGWQNEIDNTFAIARIITFYPFFISGYKISQNIKGKQISRLSATYLIGVLLFVLASVLTIYLLNNYNLGTNAKMMFAFGESGIYGFRNRILVLGTATVMILGMAMCITNKHVPFITTCGRNSLTIYLFHRIASLIFKEFFPASSFNISYIFIAAAFTLITVTILGSDTLCTWYNGVVNNIADILISSDCNQKKSSQRTVLILICSAIIFIIMAEPMITSLL